MGFSLGIFGGSFDPVHKGHIKLADFMIKKLSLDKMLIIPAAVSPFKLNTGASAEDRLNMCRLAFIGKRYEISDIELKRGGKSYTADTVFSISEKYPGARLYLIVGSDQLFSFAEWRRFKDILKKATLCAASRENAKLKFPMEKYADDNLRKYGRCVIFDFDALTISSTDIRFAAAKGKELESYVPPAVADYIKKKGLYANE